MQTSRFLKTVAAVVVMAMGGRPADAQNLVRDATTGNYLLTYTDLEGNAHSVIVEPRDKVRPDVVLAVEPQVGSLGYRYVLTNSVGAIQPLVSVTVPCPGADPTLLVTAPPTWSAEVVSRAGTTTCEFVFREALLEPGQTIRDLLILSANHPAIAEARAYGSVETIGLPTPVEETPDTVYQLLDRVQGFGFFTGGGLAVPVVAPVRPPGALADPGPGLDSVAADLSQSCALGWIVDPSTCAALAAHLDQARQALSQGDATGARAEVERFLASLTGAHGPGLPVNDNAFWLLTVNAEFIRDLLPAGNTTVTLALGTDTYLRSGSPNQNQGTEPILRLDSAAVATAAGSGTVTSARLELTPSP